MNQVSIEKTKLLAELHKNRENHRKIFLEAQENYRKMATEELDKMLQEAREGKRIRRAVSLIEPIDQTREYDRAIKMLEMSSDSIIVLSEQDAGDILDGW